MRTGRLFTVFAAWRAATRGPDATPARGLRVAGDSGPDRKRHV